jgi:hypothetical protein
MNEEESILAKFFEAENRRDWAEYTKFLSDEIEWTFFTPKGRRIVKGKENYVKTMRRIYENNNSRFTVISMASSGNDIVIAELEMGTRRSVDIFEFYNGLIYREREYYDDVYWLEQFGQESNVMFPVSIDQKIKDTIRDICERISNIKNWAIDGSSSLVLQGIDLMPNDIDILTDKDGAYEIQETLTDFVVKPVSHSSNGRYESYYGVLSRGGIKVEVIGDLRVFRNGQWSSLQNPKTVKIKRIKYLGMEIPVVSVESQLESGYLLERIMRGKQ